MPEPLGGVVYEWSFVPDDPDAQERRLVFDVNLGTLITPEQAVRFSRPAAVCLSVLLAHHDAPVTSADFAEAGLRTQGGSTVRAALRELSREPLIAQHIYQWGKRDPTYTFLEDPSNTTTLARIVTNMHLYQFMQPDAQGGWVDIGTRAAEKSRARTLLILGSLGTIAAGAAGYKIVRGIRKHTINDD